MSIRTQHYVWRHYIDAWKNEDGLVHYSRNGTILPATNPRNIMAQRDFYRLPQFSKTDANFLKLFFRSTGTSALRNSHFTLIDNFTYVARANELIQRSSRTSVEEKDYARDVVIETEEKLQGRIEQDALPILEQLRKKRCEFISNNKMAIAFFRFIAHQYFRTKRIRTDIGEELSRIMPSREFSHLANIICHISAENVGASLFVDRNNFNIIFLDDRDGVGFVTGDQPIINLMATGAGRETTELTMYYPLTPNLSCLVAPRESKLCSVDIPGPFVGEFNDLVAWESRNFLIANSKGILQNTLRRTSLTRPAARQIIDSLAKTSRFGRNS